MGEPQGRSGRFAEQKNLLVLSGIEPRTVQLCLDYDMSVCS